MDRSYLKITAFTLAEVLITLGIIGIVAALTIPTLMANSQKNAYVSGAIKYNSILQSVITRYMGDNNYSDLISSDIFNNGGGSYSQAGSQRVWDALKGYLMLSKDCGASVSTGCFPSDNIKQINNNSSGDIPEGSNLFAKGILNDGSTIWLLDDPANCSYDRSISHLNELATSCGVFTIDVNGMKGPNQYGRDEFQYRMLNNGKVLPTGTDDDYSKGCDPSSVDATANANGAPGLGTGCTFQVVMNKAMNY